MGLDLLDLIATWLYYSPHVIGEIYIESLSNNVINRTRYKESDVDGSLVDLTCIDLHVP